MVLIAFLRKSRALWQCLSINMENKWLDYQNYLLQTWYYTFYQRGALNETIL